MSDAEKERAAVAAWLLERSAMIGTTNVNEIIVGALISGLAVKIQRGDHLPEQTKGGEDATD